MRNKQIRPDEHLTRAARALALDIGLVGAAAHLRLSKMAVAALCGGLPGHRGTHVLAAIRLGVA